MSQTRISLLYGREREKDRVCPTANELKLLPELVEQLTSLLCACVCEFEPLQELLYSSQSLFHNEVEKRAPF